MSHPSQAVVPLLVALCATLPACQQPCAESTVYLDESGVDGLADAVESISEQFLGWTDQRCVAEVSITPNASMDSDQWRDDDGWATALNPDAVTVQQITWGHCRAMWFEERPQLADPDLFSDLQDFADTCSIGPIPRPFVDQAARCGAPLPDERERFLNEVVFPGHSQVVALDEPVPDGSEHVFDDSGDWDPRGYGRPAFTRTAEVFLRGTADASWYEPQDHIIEILELDGPITRIPVPELSDPDVRPHGLAADADRVAIANYWIGAPVSDQHLTVIDRDTNARTEHVLVDVPLEMSSASPAALVGNRWVRTTHEYVEQSGVWVVDLDANGPVTPTFVPLPVAPGYPPDGTQHDSIFHPEALWPDPTDPDGLFVGARHMYVEVTYSPTVFVRLYGWAVFHLDLPSGTWQTVFTADPLERQPLLTPVGIDRQGGIVFHLGVNDVDEQGDQGDLVELGALAGRQGPDGTTAVADRCLTAEELPSFVLDAGRVSVREGPVGERIWTVRDPLSR